MFFVFPHQYPISQTRAWSSLPQQALPLCRSYSAESQPCLCNKHPVTFVQSLSWRQMLVFQTKPTNRAEHVSAPETGSSSL